MSVAHIDFSANPIPVYTKAATEISPRRNRKLENMNCMGNSPSVLLPPILYKPTAFRLLQPQLEQSSVVLGTTGRLLCQRSAFAGCRTPLLPQAMQLPQHYYTAPWRGEVLRSIQGYLFHDIIKHISPPCALSQAALLPRRSTAATWRGQYFRNNFLHNTRPTALAGASLLSRRFYTTTRLSEKLDFFRRLFSPGITRGIFLPRRYSTTPWQQYCTPPARSVIHFTRNYFGCFWKVMLTATFINIMWSFVHETYLAQVPYTSGTRFVHFETVPYSNRTHLVVRSPLDDHKYGESCFSVIKYNHSSKFFSQLHPDSVRVNLITKRLISGVERGLAIKGCDAARHGVQSKKQVKSCKLQPQTTHLNGLNWEVIVMKDDARVGASSLPNGKILVYTGLLNHLDTDAEIATIIAHEIAHVIARHWSEEIIYKKWFPYPLKVHFLRRNELEADHIGMLLLAAAGFDPRIAPVAVEKLVGTDIIHPSAKKRAQLLSRANIMDEALELYRKAMPTEAP